MRMQELQRLDEAGSGESALASAKSPRIAKDAWRWLLNSDDHPSEEAAELAELLNEAAPKLGLSGFRRLRPPRSHSGLPSRSHTGLDRVHSQDSFNDRLKERMQQAVPIPTGVGRVDWARLSAVVSSEMISIAYADEEKLCPEPGSPPGREQTPPSLPRPATPTSECLEVNSGGRVLFCLFEPLPSEVASTPPLGHEGGASETSMVSLAEGGVPAAAPAGDAQHEGVLVLKFVFSRLHCQSEQFANELARHVGIAAPDCRLLRSKGPTEREWKAAAEAAERIAGSCPALYDEMARSSCMLVLEFIPGHCLFSCAEAFQGAAALRTLEHLGRLFTLDMLLGNADRLPCHALGWRGNAANVMFATAGRRTGLPVAIDAVVSRRPPGGLMSAEDAACERLVELALNDSEIAEKVLQEAVASSPAAVAAVLAAGGQAVSVFQAGLRRGLEATSGLKGLLEMMFDRVSEWIAAFLDDIESSHSITPRCAAMAFSRRSTQGHSGTGSGATGGAIEDDTLKIRAIEQEASKNEDLSGRVGAWKANFREKSEELRQALEEWQAKRSAAEPEAPLTTGFLDGVQPVVDLYELKVRLEHMLQRLRVLQQATATARPTCLLPRIFLSGAVEASSLHILRHLGVTHVLNATEDLLLPDPSRTGLQAVLRIPLRDSEEEDLAPHFPTASAFIDEALASGGGVLIHCHAGRSRSCSLMLAWLMTRRRWTLRRALDFVRAQRPEAAPNAGYMAALLVLEERLHGEQTLKVKKTKPEPKRCPECGDVVGLSTESVRLHVRLKHPKANLHRA